MLNRNVSKMLADYIAAFIERKGYERYEHHFLYRLPFLRPKAREAMINMGYIMGTVLLIYLIHFYL